MRREIEMSGRRVVLMDSISLLTGEDVGTIVVCASHGGDYAGVVALEHAPCWVSFNDAGGGKDDAGTRALVRLQDAGVPACTVSNESARIGDADDHWAGGVVSHANPLAEAQGVRVGMPLRDAVALAAEGEVRA
ncbi:hypothetical protein [Microbacterium sp. NPDC089695]|uniref:hypothetical protein n=1 Tax=Microbacterium sp. NPDC089695 TaxID=3364198 RepID=UPI00381723DD